MLALTLVPLAFMQTEWIIKACCNCNLSHVPPQAQWRVWMPMWSMATWSMTWRAAQRWRSPTLRWSKASSVDALSITVDSSWAWGEQRWPSQSKQSTSQFTNSLLGWHLCLSQQDQEGILKSSAACYLVSTQTRTHRFYTPKPNLNILFRAFSCVFDHHLNWKMLHGCIFMAAKLKSKSAYKHHTHWGYFFMSKHYIHSLSGCFKFISPKLSCSSNCIYC